MIVKIEDNPTGGPDNAEAKWWKDKLTKKREEHIANIAGINKLKQQRTNLQIQQEETERLLKILCAEYNRLVKQLASELCTYKSEHRRLEIEQNKS